MQAAWKLPSRQQAVDSKVLVIFSLTATTTNTIINNNNLYNSDSGQTEANTESSP